MGLDVYLYTKAQEEANAVHEKASDAYYEREDWPSEAEKEKAREALPPYEFVTSVPSQQHPDHLFNRRYLRSSYNGSGFERAVPEMVGQDHGLYWIFEPVKFADQYEVELTEASISALEEAKARALQVAQEIRECDPLRTTSVTAHLGHREHMWQTPPSEEQALAWYREEQVKNAGRSDLFGGGGGYSNAKGSILGFAEGLEILGVTIGQNILGMPSAILVFRMGREGLDSYVQSAEITAEFCDEAIALIRQDGSCSMHWSG